MANEIARSLRKLMTIPETLLWDELRELQRQGYQFRRQSPLEGFVVDFACYSQRLVVEVDGIQHEETEHSRKDAARDSHLKHLGFNVLRFTNGEVMENMDGVMLEILAALGAIVKHE